MIAVRGVSWWRWVVVSVGFDSFLKTGRDARLHHWLFLAFGQSCSAQSRHIYVAGCCSTGFLKTGR